MRFTTTRFFPMALILIFVIIAIFSPVSAENTTTTSTTAIPVVCNHSSSPDSDGAVAVIITDAMRVSCPVISGRCGAGCSKISVRVDSGVSTTDRLPPISFYQHDPGDAAACVEIDFRFFHPDVATDSSKRLQASYVFFSARCASGGPGVVIKHIDATRQVGVVVTASRSEATALVVDDVAVDIGDILRVNENIWRSDGITPAVDPGTYHHPAGDCMMYLRVGPYFLPAVASKDSLSRFGAFSVTNCRYACDAESRELVAGDEFSTAALIINIRHAEVFGDVILDDNTFNTKSCCRRAIRTQFNSPYTTANSATLMQSNKKVTLRRNIITMSVSDAAAIIVGADIVIKAIEMSNIAYCGSLLLVEGNTITGTVGGEMRGISFSDSGDPVRMIRAQRPNPGLKIPGVDMQGIEPSIGFYKGFVLNNQIRLVARSGGVGIEFAVQGPHLAIVRGNFVDVTLRALLAGLGEPTVATTHLVGIGYPKPRLTVRYGMPASWVELSQSDPDACASSFEFVSETQQRAPFAPSTPAGAPSCSTLCAKFTGNTVNLRTTPDRRSMLGTAAAILFHAAPEIALARGATGSTPASVCSKSMEATRNVINVSTRADYVRTFAAGIIYGAYVSSHGSCLVEENSIVVSASTATGSEGVAAVRAMGGIPGAFPGLMEKLHQQASGDPEVLARLILVIERATGAPLDSFLYRYVEQFGVVDLLGGFRLIVRRNYRLELNMYAADESAGFGNNVRDSIAAVYVRLTKTAKHSAIIIEEQQRPGIVMTDHRGFEAASSVLTIDARSGIYQFTRPEEITRTVRITNSHLRFATVSGATTASLMRNASIVRIRTEGYDVGARSRFGHFDFVSSGSKLQFLLAPETSVAYETSFFWMDNNVSREVPLRLAFAGNTSELATVLAVDTFDPNAVGPTMTTTPAPQRFISSDDIGKKKSSSNGIDMYLALRLLPSFFSTIPARSAQGSIIDVRSVSYGGLLSKPGTANFLFLPRFFMWPGPTTNLTCERNDHYRRFYSAEQALVLPPSVRETSDTAIASRCHFKGPCVALGAAAKNSDGGEVDDSRLQLSGLSSFFRDTWWYTGQGGKCQSQTRSASLTATERPVCSDVDVIRAVLLPEPVRLEGIAGVAFRVLVTFSQDKMKKAVRDAMLMVSSGDINISLNSLATEDPAASSLSSSSSSSSSNSSKPAYGDADDWTRFGPSAATDFGSSISVTGSSSSSFKIVKVRRRQGGLFLDVYLQPPDGANRLFDIIDGSLLFDRRAFLCRVQKKSSNVADTSSPWYTEEQLLRTGLLEFPRLFSFVPPVAVHAALGASATSTFLGMALGGGGGIGMGLAARRFMFSSRTFSCDMYGLTEPLPAMDHPLQFPVAGSYAAGAVVGNMCVMLFFMLVVFALVFWKQKQWAELNRNLMGDVLSMSSVAGGRGGGGGGAPRAPFTPKMLCWAGFPDTLFVVSAMLLHGTLIGVSLELSAVTNGTPGNSPARAVCLLLFCVPVVLWPLFLPSANPFPATTTNKNKEDGLS